MIGGIHPEGLIDPNLLLIQQVAHGVVYLLGVVDPTPSSFVKTNCPW